ncbi:MAG: anti-sigma factor [Planctomycetes bacterium]|nr:anti-sigma factor [Planctomycetota bacterium]
MSGLDVSHMEALAEAVVFAHEPDAPVPPVGDRQARAFERTAAMALVALAPPAEVPALLHTRLAADALRFCATRGDRVPPQPSTLGRRAAPVLTFVFGLAAGLVLYLLVAGRNGDPVPTAQQRAALLAADAGVVRLQWRAGPSPLRGSVEGDVVWSEARQEGYLTFHGLPPLDAEHRFQLWIVDGSREGAPVDGGLFTIADPAAETVVPVQAKLPIGKPAAFVVTVEPKAGVVVSKQDHVVAIASL